MPNMRIETMADSPEAKRGRMEGNDEVADVVDPGKNMGTVYCVGLYFPSTGEVRYVARDRVTPVFD